MPHYTSEHQGNTEEREKPPIGPQPAMSVRLYDLGWQPGYQGGRSYQEIVILFELSEKMKKGDFAGKHFRVTRRYRNTLGTAEKPSDLRKDLISWRKGRPFTPEEAKKFDLDRVIGKPCVLNLQQKPNGFVEVAIILPANKGQETWVPETPADYVPEWVQKAIKNQIPAPQQAATDPHAGEGAGVSDQDIPF